MLNKFLSSEFLSSKIIIIVTGYLNYSYKNNVISFNPMVKGKAGGVDGLQNILTRHTATQYFAHRFILTVELVYCT